MLQRRTQELDLVRESYGEIEIGPNLDWIVIKRYSLPPGWNKGETALLITIQPGYPTTPPDNFYVDNDLRIAGGQVPANASLDQVQLGKPWLQFSYHVEAADWKPNPDLLRGHNLLTFLLGVKRRLLELN